MNDAFVHEIQSKNLKACTITLPDEKAARALMTTILPCVLITVKKFLNSGNTLRKWET